MRLVAAATALVLVLASATPVLGWTILRNAYPDNPQSCNGQPPYFCIEWHKTANNLSTTQYVYLDASLANANLNLKPDVRNAMDKWNDVPARNPFMFETTNVNDADVIAFRADAYQYCGDPLVWACTIHVLDGYLYIIYSEVRFSDAVTWNRSLDYDVFEADSRKVSTHEFGHVEGLGHTGYTAIMKKGAVNFVGLKVNDIDGMQAIYGAYP